MAAKAVVREGRALEEAIEAGMVRKKGMGKKKAKARGAAPGPVISPCDVAMCLYSCCGNVVMPYPGVVCLPYAGLMWRRHVLGGLRSRCTCRACVGPCMTLACVSMTLAASTLEFKYVWMCLCVLMP